MRWSLTTRPSVLLGIEVRKRRCGHTSRDGAYRLTIVGTTSNHISDVKSQLAYAKFLTFETTPSISEPPGFVFLGSREPLHEIRFRLVLLSDVSSLCRLTSVISELIGHFGRS